jgi:hypothetical protein
MTVKVQADLVAPSADFARVLGRGAKVQQAASLQGTGGAAFQAWMARNQAIAAGAVTAGVKAGAEGLKTDLRARLIQGGLGERFPNAIRSAVYPQGRDSLGAAGWVFAKGKRTLQILEAYASGATIRARGGRYLAIPTAAAGRSGGRFARMTPAAWRYRRGTALRLVVPRHGKAGTLLLVARLRPGTGKRGGYRVPSAAALRRKDYDWVVVFVLVKQVEVPQRVRIADLGALWAGRIPALIERALPAL